MRWVLFVVLVPAGVLCFDAVGRLLLSSGAKFDLVRADNSNSHVLFVYFPGVLADGSSADPLLPVLRNHGNVLRVSYSGQRFQGDIVAERSAAEIARQIRQRGITRVVLLGSSVGGLVAYDTYRRLQATSALSASARVDFVVMDAPTRRAELQSPLDTLALGSRLWWAGPISNLFSRPYFNAVFKAPKAENLELGVDQDQLAQSVERAKSFPLSWSMDQNRFIISHGPIALGSLVTAGRVLYVRSMRDDDTVRPEAFDSWNKAANGTAVRVEVDSTHVGFAERPETWRKAFRLKVLPLLGFKRN